MQDGVDQALELAGLVDELGRDARLVVAAAEAFVGDVEGGEHGQLGRLADRDGRRRRVHRAVDVAGELVDVRRIERAAHRVAQALDVHHHHVVRWRLVAERRLVVHGIGVAFTVTSHLEGVELGEHVGDARAHLVAFLAHGLQFGRRRRRHR